MWVKVFDASGGWPDDPQAAWDAGYRVIAGYVNRGSWKSFTPYLRDRWLSPAHPFGFAPLFEVAGTEPVTDPTVGGDHARAARAGCRDLGVPDDVSIAYTVDRDISLAQADGPVSVYFAAVRAADTAVPLAYVENDAAALLTRKGLIVGGFTPAAYSWGDPAVLMTPANAPSYIVWTQEHNGVSVAGTGNVDAGHIRSDTPIWWEASLSGMTAQDIAAAVWSYQITSPNGTERYSSNGSQLDTVTAARHLNETVAPALLAGIATLTGRDPLSAEEVVSGVLSGLGAKPAAEAAAALGAVMSPTQLGDLIAALQALQAGTATA